jgi:transcriptional regulator with GAF, ATPase, and Fis domain
LIAGETGTGKELFARAVHLMGANHSRPFIPFNCAAIGSELAESQLFGHRRGSFTGALADNQGVIRAAEGGTLFLDEIGEMTPDLQPKLLRFLQEGEIHPVGESRPITVKVRVVAATNRDLAAEVAAGRFRADLFYRLNIFNIHLPSLRSDRERIKPLIAYYFDCYRRQAGRQGLQMSDEAVEVLRHYDWPGNVRELCAELQRLVWGTSGENVVIPDHLSAQVRQGSGGRHGHSMSQIPDKVLPGKILIDEYQSYASANDQLAREMLTRALNRCGGNVSKAAEELGMDRTGLSKALKRLGIRQ